MSVSSVAATQQIQAQQAYRPPTRSDNDQDAGSTPASSTGAAQGSGGTNPFARLVTDLQSALVSMQGSGGNAATRTGTTATATSDPMATLKSDLQSIVTQFQSGGSQGAGGGPQGAGGTHPHHHHHKDNDTQTAATTTATAATTSSATSPTGIVDSIMKAFQSTMQGGSANASASLSVSA